VTGGWSEAALGAVLRWRAPDTEVSASQSYNFAGVYSHGGGVFRKHSVPGSSFGYDRLTQLRVNDFVYPKLMAWEGALGVVPRSCDGCFVSPEFQVFDIDSTKLLPRFLDFYMRRPRVWSDLGRLSPGTNVRRRRLNAAEFLKYRISMPPLAEQQRLIARLDAVEARVTRTGKLRDEQEQELQAALRSVFHKLEKQADWIPLFEVAPLVRREVALDPECAYPELGIRSFGRGTFHKPNVLGLETAKRLFEIHAGDLVFNNVFAWEGAVAVAQPEDHGRFGSHRFITCMCDHARALPTFLYFYFLTNDGLEKLGKASPGGAGRNRTLGIGRLAQIRVPVVPLEGQVEFSKLLDLQATIRTEAAQSAQRTASLLPSLLDRIFNS
jgi:type I restriction enzyme S subunit